MAGSAIPNHDESGAPRVWGIAPHVVRLFARCRGPDIDVLEDVDVVAISVAPILACACRGRHSGAGHAEVLHEAMLVDGRADQNQLASGAGGNHRVRWRIRCHTIGALECDNVAAGILADPTVA